MLLFSLANLDFLGALAFIVAYVSAILIAMSFHEAAHAFVAFRQGDVTPKAMKRLNLMPFSHIDYVGFACLLIFGFGWAKPVPVDFRNLKHGKVSEFAVSIAGILTNIILALIFSFIYVLLHVVFAEILYSGNWYSVALTMFLNYSIVINLSLAFFNILPIYPLDGFRVVESFAGKNNAYSNFMRKYSNFVILICLITGLFSLYISYTAINVADLFILMWSKIFGI